MCEVKGKTALVTGATGGIGGAIAKKLIEGGARVAVSGTREEALQQLAQELGNDTVPLVARLNEEGQAANLVKRAEEALEGLDILVCNAGVTKDNLAMRMSDEDWRSVLSINLDATFAMNKAVLRGMMKRRFGRIINISSVVATMGNPGQTNYCASKAGMIGMSKALAQEVASRGITVNCIAPGFIRTAMTDALNDEQQQRITANIPAQDFGTPEDVAEATAYLASTGARYVTGQTLHVNGGLLMV